jgi:AAA15 family ATPase/GTPase
MLIEFALENFRSFRGQQRLSLVAGHAKEMRAENTFQSLARGTPPLLRSCAVYGANAAGKSNLLRGLQQMQSLVLRSANLQQGMPLPHTPFAFAADSRAAPTEFEVLFVEEGVRYQFGFSFDAERIHAEWLLAFPLGQTQRLYERRFDAAQQSYDWHFSSGFKGNKKVWQETTRDNALFLSTAVQLNSERLLPVFRWFQQRLVVITDNVAMNQNLTLTRLDNPADRQKLMNLLRCADLGIVDVQVRRDIVAGMPLAEPAAALGGAMPKPSIEVLSISSLHQSSDDQSMVALPLTEESHGTQRLFNTAGAWLNVLEKGEVLLYDEIDTSLHPLMVRFLVKQFHSAETNPENAQLVFTTHDVSMLEDRELLRRDQVWFADKNDKGESSVYPLTDFSPRKEESIGKRYLRGSYGAIPLLRSPGR